MAEQHHRVQVEAVHWPTLLPGLHLFRSFRMAIHPAKLALSLILIVLLYLGGVAMDFIWGPQVFTREFEQYKALPADGYERFLDLNRQALEETRQRKGVVRLDRIFDTVLAEELQAFEHMATAATELDFGIGEFFSRPGRGGGVLGALVTMVVVVPGWLYQTHPGFLTLYLLYAFLLTAILGGAIARLAALHACRDERAGALAGLKFAAARYPWFVSAPLIPLALVLAIGLVMAVGGWALFNLPVTDLLGGLGFGLFLLGAFVMALLLVGFAAGVNLLFPAIAVEGTDAFDAISRAFNYVLGRPWRYLFYTAVALVYGAITYLFVGFVLYLTLWVTKVFVGLWAGGGRFDAILPAPQFGELLYEPNWAALDGSGSVAAAMVLVWVKLLLALLPAFWVSFYLVSQTWIYLLLRQAADGAEFDDVYVSASQPQGQAADTVEPSTTTGTEEPPAVDSVSGDND
jgi:hypothetical protein